MEQAIFLKNICKKYEGFALQNVSFSQPKGTIMGFIGENGAGKTTTIKLMLNLIHRDHGELLILGRDPRGDFNEVKEALGVVMDEIGFPENLTATNLNTMMKQIYRNWDETIFDNYLLKFRLPGQKLIKTFSKGMKMKLSLAVALSHHAKLLILDEATSGLDPIVREEIIDFLWILSKMRKTRSL
jgi:ABC-2 type transport system ATP-binding protein